jgi:hypothetical protein
MTHLFLPKRSPLFHSRTVIDTLCAHLTSHNLECCIQDEQQEDDAYRTISKKYYRKYYSRILLRALPGGPPIVLLPHFPLSKILHRSARCTGYLKKRFSSRGHAYQTGRNENLPAARAGHAILFMTRGHEVFLYLQYSTTHADPDLACWSNLLIPYGV